MKRADLLRRTALAAAAALAACSPALPATPAGTAGAPSAAATPPTESLTPSPTAMALADTGPLEGRWVAGPVPIQDIKLNMRAFYDISNKEADAWIKEIGSPSTLTLSLKFAGNLFTERWQTPGQPMEIGEAGTVARTTVAGNSNYVILNVDGDTYTLHFGVDHDHLALHWVDSTDTGTAADKAKHRLYTIGFYCSAAFTRVP